MKKLIMPLALIALPFFAWAQFSISGTVTDASDKQPLAGVNVTIVNTYTGTFTNSQGEFALKNLKAGKYQVQVSFVGYEKVLQEVDVQQDVTLDFSLETATILADEVIVRATRAWEKSPTTFTNLSAKDLKAQNLGQDLPFLLNQTPSVVVNSDAGAGVGYTGIRIRGSDATRINVTINGIPYNEAESQGTFWVNLPDFASSVNNIQIQRGVGTSTNGAGAFGASINIQTTSLNQDAYGEVNNTYGSFNTWKHTLKFGSGLINGKWAFDGRLSKVSSDGYIDRASSDLKSFFVSGGYHGKSTLVKLNVFSGKEITYQAWNGTPESRIRNDAAGMQAYIERNYLSEVDAQNLLNSGRTYNAYTYDNEVDNYQQDHYQLILSQGINKYWNLNAALHLTRGRGYFEQYRQNDDFEEYGLPGLQIGDSLITSTDLIRRRWLDNYFYGFTYSANYNSLGKLSGIIGGGWNRYDGGHFGEIIWARFTGNSNIRDKYYDNDALKTDFNIYGKANYQFVEQLNGYIDLQYRRINYSFLGNVVDSESVRRSVQQEVTLNFFNPKAGLTFQVNNGLNLYASYSVANREPTRDDYTQSTPQSRPKAETLRNVEAGFRRQNKNTLLNINYYLMDYKNQLVLTGQINDVGEYNRTNIPRSYRMGVEIEGAIKLLPNLQWAANATFSRNKIRNYQEFIDDYDAGEQVATEYESTDIAFSPNITAASTISFSPVKNLSLNLVSKYVGEQFLDNTSSDSRKLDDFFVNDIRINYTLQTRLVKEIGLNLLMNNIFNVEYEPNGYTYSYRSGGAITTENFYYPQAGTNFLASINLKF
ncbi:TonB-dependent receptor [Rhodocytophaga rosea]|uniref:TonB-dependent receptor n=1 Tax=Rhodocytophaga rosea TaxID=2704465 RepID=A0A6C0GG79_9BACT|nr:TonB-dependent receptor [Rhodocytophaga rosea]QHT67016.1 TonB-dependent receptor [Rhodocytophaga rosea]